MSTSRPWGLPSGHFEEESRVAMALAAGPDPIIKTSHLSSAAGEGSAGDANNCWRLLLLLLAAAILGRPRLVVPSGNAGIDAARACLPAIFCDEVNATGTKAWQVLVAVTAKTTRTITADRLWDHMIVLCSLKPSVET